LEQIIKSHIMTGELLPGQQIPTEKELADVYKVSTIALLKIPFRKSCVTC